MTLREFFLHDKVIFIPLVLWDSVVQLSHPDQEAPLKVKHIKTLAYDMFQYHNTL